jgi:glycine oxidase
MVSAPTVSVVGGGVIGLSVAWRAAAAGWRVTVHDPAADGSIPTAAAAWVAGGMLTPITEGSTAADDVAYGLGAASLGRWPWFAAELEKAAGRPSGLRAEGSLAVGFDAASLDMLVLHSERLAALGQRVSVLRGPACRAIEPMLSPRVLGGIAIPADLAVDNRALLSALRHACLRVGVMMDRRTVTDLAVLTADQLVLAAGAWSAALLPGAPVRPVKGEILRLRAGAGNSPPPLHTIRAVLPDGHVYLVPRFDGVVVGATQQDAGFDARVTHAGVARLLANAASVLPELADYSLAEASAGLRPTTPDGLPLLGRFDEKMVLATGHGRNGLLLAPITADLVVAALSGDQLPEALLAAADAGLVRPNRFPEIARNATIAT